MSIKDKLQNVFIGDPDYIAQGILNNGYLHDPGRPDFKGGSYTLRLWRQDFYHWQGGYWQRQTDNEIRRIVTDHIQELNEQSDAEQIPISTNRINNVLLCLLGRIGIPEAREIETWDDGREKLYHTIAFNNGLLVLRRSENEPPKLIDHTPHYFGANKLPYNFDPEATCPEWDEFLDDVMLGRTGYVQVLQQWAGYLLRPDLLEHKFLLCVGSGQNGKGVYSEVIEAMVGTGNCSHVSLNALRYRFAIHTTLGKVVNITDESSHFVADEAETTLKTMVSGDRMEFPRKWKEPVNASPTAKMMISTNAKPRFGDKTQGLWRRLLLVPFDKTIEEDLRIKGYAKQIIKKELPGILNWALEGLQKLNKSGFILPEENTKLLEEYRREADPARAFLLENYTVSFDTVGTPCADVFRHYCQYCEENHCRTMNNKTFGVQVKQLFPDVERKRTGSRGSRIWIYEGLVSQEELS